MFLKLSHSKYMQTPVGISMNKSRILIFFNKAWVVLYQLENKPGLQKVRLNTLKSPIQKTVSFKKHKINPPCFVLPPPFLV